MPVIRLGLLLGYLGMRLLLRLRDWELARRWEGLVIVRLLLAVLLRVALISWLRLVILLL